MMDPNAALQAVRGYAGEVENTRADDYPNDVSHDDAGVSNELALALAFADLDEWLTKGGFLPEAWRDKRPYLYEKCKECHLFVEATGNPPYKGLEDYTHLHRGDEADEELDESHLAQPSGMFATLETWKMFGPAEMQARFTDMPVALLEFNDDNYGEFTCPSCGLKDTICEVNIGLDWAEAYDITRFPDGDIKITWSSDRDGVDFEGEGYVCRRCGVKVRMPSDVKIVEDYA